MKLPVSIAKKLLQMMQGERLPASVLQHAVVHAMLDDGILQKVQKQRTAIIYVSDAAALNAYLQNQFHIHDLQQYVGAFEADELTRSEAVVAAGNSKLRSIRTFKGFLVNSFAPVPAVLDGRKIVIQPTAGTCTFIHQFESFFPADDFTIVGVENPENFFAINKQQELFSHLRPLFVCRYPQGNDLVKWLTSISNAYLHFGDFDIEGINIYLHEYKRYLHERARFFVPPNIKDLVAKYGNRNLYNQQSGRTPASSEIEEPALLHLLDTIHHYKKGLEQEALIDPLLQQI